MRPRTPDTVSRPIGGYSHAVEVGHNPRWLHISGQVPERPDGSVPSGFGAQCAQVWENIRLILAAADMSIGNLVKVTTYLSDRRYADANGRIRRRILGDHQPALTVVVATILEPQWLLEIEAIAAA